MESIRIGFECATSVFCSTALQDLCGVAGFLLGFVMIDFAAKKLEWIAHRNEDHDHVPTSTTVENVVPHFAVLQPNALRDEARIGRCSVLIVVELKLKMRKMRGRSHNTHLLEEL